MTSFLNKLQHLAQQFSQAKASHLVYRAQTRVIEFHRDAHKGPEVPPVLLKGVWTMTEGTRGCCTQVFQFSAGHSTNLLRSLTRVWWWQVSGAVTFAVPHSSFLTLMAILSPKQLWHFLMKQEHGADPSLTTGWAESSSPQSLGDALLPHHHRGAALSICIIPKTRGWDWCCLWGSPEHKHLPFSLLPHEYSCAQFSSKGGEKEAPVTNSQAHFTSRHCKTQIMSTRHSLFHLYCKHWSMKPSDLLWKSPQGKKKWPILRLFYSSVVKPWKDNICISTVILKSVYL